MSWYSILYELFVFRGLVNLKNLVCIGFFFSSCSATYNPEGFICTIDNAYNNMSIRMTNPPLYMYEWDGIKSEFTDTKIYLKSLEYFVEHNGDNTINLKYIIVSEYGSCHADLKNMQRLWDGPISMQPNSYTITLSISDLFESSIFTEFDTGFGRVCIQWYPFVKLLIERAINPFVGQKIFIDEYLQQ